MSGSGGFYKYRCKYFYTYECPNWVYANGHACAMCLAEGREELETSASSTTAAPTTSSSNNTASTTAAFSSSSSATAAFHPHPRPRPQHPSQPSPWLSLTEICVPQAFHGTLRYTVMEVVPDGAYWLLRRKALEPPAGAALPLGSMTTSDTPRPVVSTAGVGGGGAGGGVGLGGGGGMGTMGMAMMGMGVGGMGMGMPVQMGY